MAAFPSSVFGGGTALISLTSLFVAVCAWSSFFCSDAFEMPPLKSVAMSLMDCSHEATAVQTPSA